MNPMGRATNDKAFQTISLLCFLVMTFALSVPAGALTTTLSTIYVGQAASGNADGSSCANQEPVSFFNSSANWGSGSNQIGPGTTVHVCGRVTTAMVAQGSGVAGSPVTVVWEPGASLSVCSTSGAFQLNNRAYFVLDLGGNSAAVTCPNNGTSLSSQTNATGIGSSGAGWSHTEIRNGTVGPMYVYSGTANDGFGSICINGGNGANNTYAHDLQLTGCAEGIEVDPTSSSTDDFSYLTVTSTVGRVLNYASGSSSNMNLANSSFHNNDVNYSTVWSVPGGYEHYEAIHIYASGGSGAQDKITNFQIYDNYFHGSSPTNSGSTALMFIGMGQGSCASTNYEEVKIFNNLITDAGNLSNGFSSGTGSYIYTQDCNHTLSVYNNTIDGGGTSNACFRALNSEGTTGNSWTLKNNICENAHWAFYNDANEPLTSDYNDFYNIGGGHWQVNGSTYSTLANWQSASGQDGNSSSATPGLNSNYTLSASGGAAQGKGLNLTSLNVSTLDTSKPTTVGNGSDLNTGILRLSGGNWDLGAYASGTSATLPAPPSNLAVISIQ